MALISSPEMHTRRLISTTQYATAMVDAPGSLTLEGQTSPLAPEVVARSAILSHLVENAAEGEHVPLPLPDQATVLAWLKGVAAAEGGPTRMEQLGLSPRELARTLTVRRLCCYAWNIDAVG